MKLRDDSVGKVFWCKAAGRHSAFKHWSRDQSTIGAGGSVDFVARLMEQRLSEQLVCYVRFGSILLKKSVFTNDPIFPEALVRSSENYVGDRIINLPSNGQRS
jgi:hypothetical protein